MSKRRSGKQSQLTVRKVDRRKESQPAAARQPKQTSRTTPTAAHQVLTEARSRNAKSVMAHTRYTAHAGVGLAMPKTIECLACEHIPALAEAPSTRARFVSKRARGEERALRGGSSACFGRGGPVIHERGPRAPRLLPGPPGRGRQVGGSVRRGLAQRSARRLCPPWCSRRSPAPPSAPASAPRTCRACG